jgi:cell division protein FtsA
VVLTGAASQLVGAHDLARRILSTEPGKEKQVRAGRPQALRGLPDAASGPAFATAAGLLAWAAGQGRTMHDIDFEVERPAGLLRRIVAFLRERV